MRFSPPEGLRAVTREEMKLIDSISQESFKIPGAALMETAGRAVAEAVADAWGPLADKRVWALVGTGANGGDGCVAARYLANWKARVSVAVVGRTGGMADTDAAAFLLAVERMGLEVETVATSQAATRLMARLAEADVVVDAILGIGLAASAGRVREPAATLIEGLNGLGRNVVAVDVPSGLDANSGEVIGVCARARLTVTMGLPKKGLLSAAGPDHAGKIRVADLGYPQVLLDEPRGVYLHQKTGHKMGTERKDA